MNTDTQLDVVFFDVKDTLGVIDSPGHLVVYKPSTERLLAAMRDLVGVRIGIITNLPKNVSAEQGRAMLEEAGILAYVDPHGLIINHEAGSDKPGSEIYYYAAKQMGVPVERCAFVGENLIEVLGAQAAGMRGVLKPCPPGREFKLKPIQAQDETETFSGRLAEIMMEEEHLVGKRIVGCAAKIAERLAEGTSPPLRAMEILVFLAHNYVDRFHHAKEEQVLLPLGFARGFPREKAEFVYREHDQGRAYFAGLSSALERVNSGDEGALEDFRHALDGFVSLYKQHGKKEDDELLPELGRHLHPTDDAIIVDLMERIGPGDPGPWYSLIASMENELR